jgi:glycerol kinase
VTYLLALDQGTTSSRAIVFDSAGTQVAVAQQEFAQHFPQAGWVEHSPDDIWQSQLAVAREAITKANISPKQISGIGIANQRETTVVWERATGKPIYNAIVWQDRRTANMCDELKQLGFEKTFREKTGLVLDPYFSGTKIKWILDNVSNARARAEKGELAFGTIDSWLLWNLTDGQTHATDVSNASRTLLFNIHDNKWDDELLNILNIPQSMLPSAHLSSFNYGKTKQDIFGESILIGGIAGDQQAALFGQACHQTGMAKNTYGTGCFMLMQTGNNAQLSQNGLLTTSAAQINEKQFALEGSVFIGGAVVQWLRDGLGIIKNSADVEVLASSVKDTGGVFFVPAFTGLGAPYWDAYARGGIFGLTRGSTSAHIARAAVESIAYQSTDVLMAMQRDAGQSITQLRVDGGASANNLLMQFQADILGVEVIRPKIIETTALGAAYLAGLRCGVWKNTDELSAQWQKERSFEPRMSRDEANHLMTRWNSAIERAKNWESN